MEDLQKWADDLNANPDQLPMRGPASKYRVTDKENKEHVGRVKLTFEGEPFPGIACDVTSPGYLAMCKAITEVRGEAKPYSICGSLPLVGELKESGLDVQVIGFGKSEVYHGHNEYTLLSDMKDATKILSKVVPSFRWPTTCG
eukprot:m.281053 g.281053  ORF g.281053 m.281053 type:complete len:143 (+) comp11104_c0_seq55:902-1330(+)